MDIQKAISIEEKYVQNRLNGIDDCLIERMSSVPDFTSLEDYFEQKKQFLVNQCHCKIEHSEILDIPKTLSKLMNSQNSSLLIVPSDRNFVYHGSEEYNEDFCKQNNLYVCEIGHQGGNIVVGPKDISFGIMIPEDIGINTDWVLKGYAQIFRKYNYNVEINNNDILINGIKILGGASFYYNNKFIHVCNISFSDTSELIDQICLIKRIKQPGSIPPPLTREELSKEVVLWLQAR